MDGQKPGLAKIDQTLTSEPFEAGPRTVQLVARMTGWQFTAGNGNGDFQGALVRLSPHACQIAQGDQQQTVQIQDPTQDALRGILLAGLLVSGLCWIIRFVVRLSLKRSAKL
jgi:hypothetical protein